MNLRQKNMLDSIKMYLKSLFIIFIIGFILPVVVDYALFNIYTKNITYRNSVFVGNFYNDTNILSTYLWLLKKYIIYR